MSSPVTILPHNVNNRLAVVETFTDRASFQTAFTDNCGGETLTMEDFGALPGGITTCGPLVSSAGDAGCFAAGDLVDGFTITTDLSNGDGNIVGITSGSIGNSIDLVGANDFVEETIITFSTPTAALGVDIWFNSETDTRVDVMDTGGALIESFTVVGIVGVENFFGFYSDEPVGSVQLAQINDGGELIGNMEFGNCTVLNVTENLLSQVSIFPNPTASNITINTPAGITIKTAVLYDVLGKLVNNTIKNSQMDLSSLSRGVYLLSVETDAGTLTKKIVKQ